MKSRLEQELPEMMSLAYQRTEGARVELAGMLADVFLSEDTRLSLRQVELVNELIDQLMQTRTPAVRAQLVRKFAASSVTKVPRKLALSLACDTIDVAREVLASNVMLTDDDLIAVVETQSRDHAEAVARRTYINEAVADALVTTGDIRVMQMVAENMGASLSPKAVDILSSAARFTAALREPIMNRPEMTRDAAGKLYWWMSQELRRHALGRFGMSATQVDQNLAKTIEDYLGYHDLEKDNDETMIKVADWLADREAASVKVLPQVLRLGHFRLFNILLSRLSNVGLSLIDTIMAETGGRGLAAICRAIGVDKAAFVSIFLLSRGARTGDHIVHPRELSHAIAAYDRVSVKLAQDLMHSWIQDPTYFTKRTESALVGA